MISLFIFGPAFTEIVILLCLVLVWIVGIAVVCGKKDLSAADRLVWIILMLVFNAFALLAFMFWYPLSQRKA